MELQELQSLIVAEKSRPAGKLLVPYGPTGIGKTTLFCQGPNTLLVQCGDESAAVLKESGGLPESLPVVSAENFDHALRIFTALATDTSHGYKKIVVDGGSGLKKWVDQMTLANECDGEKGKFASFAFGEKSAAFYWMDLMEHLYAMRRAGLWVFFICHKGTLNEKNPQGVDYPKTAPDLGKDRLALTIKDADAVLLMDYVIGEQYVDKKTGKGKAVGGQQRVMYTTGGAAFESKNRMDLPEIIVLGDSPQEAFQAFGKAVKQGRKQAQ